MAPIQVQYFAIFIIASAVLIHLQGVESGYVGPFKTSHPNAERKGDCEYCSHVGSCDFMQDAGTDSEGKKIFYASGEQVPCSDFCSGGSVICKDCKINGQSIKGMANAC